MVPFLATLMLPQPPPHNWWTPTACILEKEDDHDSSFHHLAAVSISTARRWQSSSTLCCGFHILRYISDAWIHLKFSPHTCYASRILGAHTVAIFYEKEYPMLRSDVSRWRHTSSRRQEHNLEDKSNHGQLFHGWQCRFVIFDNLLWVNYSIFGFYLCWEKPHLIIQCCHCQLSI